MWEGGRGDSNRRLPFPQAMGQLIAGEQTNQDHIHRIINPILVELLT